MTIEHELEPTYILGDFTLQPAKSGFVIVPPRPVKLEQPVAHGKSQEGTGASPRRVGWNQHGYPFFAEGFSYAQEFDVPELNGRFVVSLRDWYGSVARVFVNGELAGYIWRQPWDCDVTSRIRSGRNRIEVVIVGTLRNTLGPHHAGHLVGAAWPHMFSRGPDSGPPPGDAYDTLAYGLFEPFRLQIHSRD